MFEKAHGSPLFPTKRKVMRQGRGDAMKKKDPRDSIATTWLQNDSGDDKTHAKASLKVFFTGFASRAAPCRGTCSWR